MLATLLSGFSGAVLGPVTYFLAVGTLISSEVGVFLTWVRITSNAAELLSLFLC